MYQEVNPNITSFGQLEKTVGNVKNPMQSLDNTTTALTIAAGNLTTDVNNLAQAIGQNLNQAMAAGDTAGQRRAGRVRQLRDCRC